MHPHSVVGEERLVLAPHSLEEEGVVNLISVLLSWINDTLEERRIVVKDITEDIYDGQVLGELLGECVWSVCGVRSVICVWYVR